MQDSLLPKLPHIVIIGAGFGGLKAAQTLGNAKAQITLMDRRNHHLFQPLLYQVATAGLSPANIASPIRNIVRKQKNTEVLMAEVTGVDIKNKAVLTKDERRISYDYLIIATGATHSYFGHANWEKFAPGLKSIEDALTIRRKILLAFEKAEMEPSPAKRQMLLTFVLIGAGPTGVEMAGSIAELAHVALDRDFRHIDPKSARVILMEAGPRILAGFPESLSQKAKLALEKLGVEVKTNTRVEEVDEQGVIVSKERILSQTVIWTAGVTASPVASWLGVPPDLNNRVKVLPDLTVPENPEIFVIGDVASVTGENGKPLPGVAPVAMQEGRYAAASILNRMQGLKTLPPFHYIDKGNLATIGRSSAVADLWSIQLSGFIAWITWIVVHIFYLIGFRNRLLVMIEWALAYVTFQRGARLITLEK